MGICIYSKNINSTQPVPQGSWDPPVAGFGIDAVQLSPRSSPWCFTSGETISRKSHAVTNWVTVSQKSCPFGDMCIYVSNII